ncbi:proline iminopeptidase [Pseudohongiella nitratireducens]|uniref:Proline iminopeptidase n=2 Tax=Pseudohongiella nitratireducens TaxID=1768907 RepID=A0A917GRA8_9GAMM|nr:proline iminopeptidase [Pseudohongiella nitratireducens]
MLGINMRKLYPEIEPFNRGYLQVSETHRLYYEQVGNPHGKPVVFLHGGPGGGINPEQRRYFDPAKWHVILFDQRGCGQSEPFASVEENTTWDLVADIERLREHVGVTSWAVFGGSWGSTLSLAYAITHPQRCTALFLRGIFLLRHHELQWFYQQGCSRLFPDAWEAYIDPIPENERDDMIQAYYRRLTSTDAAVRQQAAKAWSVWEGTTSRLEQSPEAIAAFADDDFADAFARIECHYFMNHGFFPEDNYLLNNAALISRIPTVIVHGRYDVICPVENAWQLKKAMPHADLHIIPCAGHAMSEPGIRDKLIEYTDRWSDEITKN